jgi:hypothetical protein
MVVLMFAVFIFRRGRVNQKPVRLSKMFSGGSAADLRSNRLAEKIDWAVGMGRAYAGGRFFAHESHPKLAQTIRRF